jgi:putative endonuclease
MKQMDSIEEAIAREKSIQKCYRKWKIELIESFNPEWNDFYYELDGEEYNKGYGNYKRG